jgi:hypothetical protein
MWHVKMADGLAEKAGITRDDYVLQVMGQYVTGQDDFEQKISSRVHGAKVELLLVSDLSGKKRTVKIDLPLHGTQVPCVDACGESKAESPPAATNADLRRHQATPQSDGTPAILSPAPPVIGLRLRLMQAMRRCNRLA